MFKQHLDASVLDKDPYVVLNALQLGWARRVHKPAEKLGHPDRRSDLDPKLAVGDLKALSHEHLIYAYMIENTRIYEIFRRVVHELLHGEKLGPPTDECQNWLRTTEAVFYHEPFPGLIPDVVSHVRPSLGANRCNAYQRMFAMNLNHGSDDGKPFVYVKADAANGEFVPTLEEFLREVWIGMTYVTATASANPTDKAKIAELAKKLHDMLRSRRQGGNLAREEFTFVAMMSWFHLTISSDTPIVKALRAESPGAEQRLFRIAERVGLPAHGLSKNFFEIAEPLSRILIQIEAGFYGDSNEVPALYTQNPAGGPEADMRTIIMNWEAITGRSLKERKLPATAS